MSPSRSRTKCTRNRNNSSSDSPSSHLPVEQAFPKIGITMGDPTGIGPEIIVHSLSRQEPFQVCRPVVFGDRDVLLRAIRIQHLSVSIEPIDRIPEKGYQPGKIF